MATWSQRSAPRTLITASQPQKVNTASAAPRLGHLGHVGPGVPSAGDGRIANVMTAAIRSAGAARDGHRRAAEAPPHWPRRLREPGWPALAGTSGNRAAPRRTTSGPKAW